MICNFLYSIIFYNKLIINDNKPNNNKLIIIEYMYHTNQEVNKFTKTRVSRSLFHFGDRMSPDRRSSDRQKKYDITERFK